MPDMQHVQATQHRTRRRGWGPPLALAGLAAVLSLALAGPAIAAEPPTVTRVEPTRGPTDGGTRVKITGTHFTQPIKVNFGSTTVPPWIFLGETEIQAISPSEPAGTVDVTVTTAAGTSPTSPEDRFTYGGDEVTGLSPGYGTPLGGTSVTIRGGGFTGTTAVTFGATSAKSFTVNSGTSITAVSPAHTTGNAEVRVETPEGCIPPRCVASFYYEAQPHRYKKEGVYLAEGSKTFIQGWGTLRLLVKGVVYTCRNAEGGYIENPMGGGAGVGATELFSGYTCTFASCPTFPNVLAEELPWPSALGEPAAGVIRARTTGIKQDYQCWETKAAFEKATRGEGGLPNAKNVFIEELGGGGLTPKPESGTSAAHPGFLEFGPTAGLLEQEGSNGAFLAETEGKMKILGYKEAEVINVE